MASFEVNCAHTALASTPFANSKITAMTSGMTQYSPILTLPSFTFKSNRVETNIPMLARTNMDIESAIEFPFPFAHIMLSTEQKRKRMTAFEIDKNAKSPQGDFYIYKSARI